jgi:DNA-binding NarL/FixJ family response regulator
MGGLAAMVGDVEAARAHFAAALEVAERSGSPLWRVQVQHDWATADRSQHELLQAALSTAEGLALGRLAHSCRAALLGEGPASRRAPTMTAAPEPVRSPPDGLSEREVEVLRLVATGLSNRQIGERLFISANTAANHVRSILQKTGSANRAEATAYAARRGLLQY